VDDDPRVLTAFQRTLGDQFNLDTAPGGAEALELLAANGPYAVVVADMHMPDMDGIEMLMHVEQAAPETIRMMLTGNADQQTAADAVNQGHVYRFLNKPCTPEMLALALDAGISHYHTRVAERELLETTLNGSVQMLLDVLAMADPRAFATGQKLRDLVRVVAASLQPDHTWELELAAMLSRIGCVTIPQTVFEKHRAGFRLTGPEKDLMQRIPEIGARLIANVPRLGTASRIVLYQEKHFDGSGFPLDSVEGEDIPIGARLLKILSDLLQLETKGAPRFRALEQLHERAGLYDPKLLETARVCFGCREPSAQLRRAVTLRELKPGDTLAAPVESKDGMMIAGAGLRITPAVLEKLNNFSHLSGLQEPLYIELSPDEAPIATSPAKRD
jgi:response regulator RpfG family c-di-GMP phosphodiesterase